MLAHRRWLRYTPEVVEPAEVELPAMPSEPAPPGTSPDHPMVLSGHYHIVEA